MKQDHQTSFGRRNTPVPAQEATELCDKWQLLNTLTQAAETFGLNHRTLSVLRALLSFHPDRVVSTQPRSCIVFPANRTISSRLGGMPESTLRRHLAALVASGIVSRHDSANRKRFARGQHLAFGFDLSPLAQLAPRIAKAAIAAEQQREILQAHRAELGALRQQLIDLDGPSELTEQSFKILRRKPVAEDLIAAITALKEVLGSLKMSVTNIQNGRHTEKENITISEEHAEPKAEITNLPSFEQVVLHCSEYQSFFPEPVRDWQDLSRIAYAIAPMIGIEAPVYAQALDQLGPKAAIAVTLSMLESLSDIRNPGGYLRSLVQQDKQRKLDVSGLMRRLTLKSR